MEDTFINEEDHLDKEILYCSYCKDKIRLDDDLMFDDEKPYHKDCFKQMNTFYSPLEGFKNE